jgi:peptidoglycan-associated lipoprotein
MTMTPLKTTVSILALASLVGCASWVQSLDVTAGSSIDEGRFGKLTAQNVAMQRGQGGNIVVDLNSRFSAEIDPMINFGFNSAQLDASAQTTLRRQATWIRQFPEVRFRVYGHTDLVGGAGYNKRLGLARAQAVVSYLATQGVSRSRLEALASLGETQPLIVTDGRERRNRRTITQVSGFVGAGNGAGCCLDAKYATVIHRDYVASAQQAPTIENADSN